jgi:hypothetical protein
MGTYNKRDVDLLEQVHDRLSCWNPNPPVLMSGDCCPSCRSFQVNRRGWNIAKKSRAARMQCQECGQWFSGARELVK